MITKHDGHGGLVSVGTVTAQLLYEIGGPEYLNPDVTARFDTIHLTEIGPNRVQISGVRGEPPPPTHKVCMNYAGGLRMNFSLQAHRPRHRGEGRARRADDLGRRSPAGRTPSRRRTSS